MRRILIHGVNVAHPRLVELAKLADQAKPYYDFIERQAKIITADHRDLDSILKTASKETIRSIVSKCFDSNPNCPLLFDGIGRPYTATQACYFFLSWLARDAPAQRLNPLITQMTASGAVRKKTARIDTLTSLLYEYKSTLKSFQWDAIREVIIDRLEGSRRSVSGHIQEAVFRTALATAIQNYHYAHSGYGNFSQVVISNKQQRVGNQTIDISITLHHNNGTEKHIYMPVKTRETQGGGHAHLFSRDLIAAITAIKAHEPDSVVGVFIVSENWNVEDLSSVNSEVKKIFHYSINPNEMQCLSDDEQLEINRFIDSILSNE